MDIIDRFINIISYLFHNFRDSYKSQLLDTHQETNSH